MAESINGRQQEAGDGRFGLKEILKGEDPRIVEYLRRQIPFIVLCMVLVLVYIGNRYDSQRDIIRIEQLRKELTDVRYQALNTTSDLSAKSKPSYIEKVVGSGNSGLQSSMQPPFRIKSKRRK